jgi:lysozyme
LVKQFEGFSAKPYKCPAGVWTIGYGHTHGVTMGTDSMTERDAETLLRNELDRFATHVNDLVNVPLTQNQFDALVSFHYTTGALGKSTLLTKLNQGFYEPAAKELLRWTRAGGKVLGGLVKRRGAEMSLFLEA